MNLNKTNQQFNIKMNTTNLKILNYVQLLCLDWSAAIYIAISISMLNAANFLAIQCPLCLFSTFKFLWLLGEAVYQF